VRIALLGVLGPVPDVVVSGVNFGANMGNDVTYSGTVGAALEAALHSVPGIAFSVESREPRHLEGAVPLMHELTARLLRAPLPAGTALNVNLPDRPAGDIRGLKVTSLGGSSRYDTVAIDMGDGASGEHWLRCQRAPLEPWAITDFDAVEKGYVSLTPIHYELTSREGLAALAGWTLDELIEGGRAARERGGELSAPSASTAAGAGATGTS
jgi:5'-nucleotidase